MLWLSKRASEPKRKAICGLRRHPDDSARSSNRSLNHNDHSLARMRRRHRCFLLPYWIGSIFGAAVARRGACSGNGKPSREDPRCVLESIRHFLHSLYSPEGLRELIASGGAPLVCTIVFIETGFFVGFFLPGDSLLITAGIFSSYPGGVPLRWLLLPAMLCAIAGDQIGYWVGRSAGAAKMPYSRYLLFDIFGGVIWVGTMILGGYSLGHFIPNIGQYIHYVIAVVIVLSIIPAIVSLLRTRRELGRETAKAPASTGHPTVDE